MKVKTNLERRVNDLRAIRKSYPQIAEELGITREEVGRLVFKRPNAGAARKTIVSSPYPDITPEYLAGYKRRLQIGQKVTVRNHLYEKVKGGSGEYRRKSWVTAKVITKYPHIAVLSNGHSVTYQELICYERYGKTVENDL